MKRLFSAFALVLFLLPGFSHAQVNLPQGGTGWATSTPGDLLVGTTSIRYTRLPIGPSGYILQSNGVTPQWVATSSSGIGDYWSLSTSLNSIYPTDTSHRVMIGSSTLATSTDAELLSVDGDVGALGYFYVGPFAYDGISPGLEGTFDPEYFIADFTAQEGHNHYAAVSLNNFNNGTSSSIDLTFNNDLTSDQDGDGEFSYYCDMGMNSSQYNDPFYGLQNVPNMGYWYCKDSPVSIASATSSATAGYINFLTGGWAAEAMRITNTGAVGIGSTSPAARLVVTNPLSTNSLIIEDQATDTTPFVIDASGNVAIGSTTVPTGRLAISCAGTVSSTNNCFYMKNASNFDAFRVLDSGSAIFGRNLTQLTATPINVSFGGSYGNGAPGSVTNLKWDLYNDGSTRNGIGMSASLMEFRVGLNNSMGFYTNNGTFAMIITAAQRVGIGTSTPQTGLHVSGADTASRMQLAVQSTGTSGGISLWNSSDTRVGYLYFTATELQLSRSSRAFTIDNQFYITSSGNVGIGTTTPGTDGLRVTNGVISNYSTSATGVLQSTVNTGFSGFNMNNESGTLTGSFQVGNSNVAVAGLQNQFFLGPRQSGNSLLFVQGTAATIAGGYDSNQVFFWGTSTPTVANAKMIVYTTGTTTVAIDSNHASRGGCIEIKDADGSGYTYLSVNNGAATFSATSCK